MLRTGLGASYSPLYFLAALGAGGLAVSFFLYPMFWVPHPDTAMVTFNHLWPRLLGGPWWQRLLLSADLLAVLFFAGLHLRLLLWNLREYVQFRRSEAHAALLRSNAEISLMAIPLTLAMSINVSFVLGALFVPNLWSVVEWLFPFAIIGFLAVGVYAMRILLSYFGRVLAEGGVDFASNNSLAPMLAIFALAMIAVGLAAPGAMSTHVVTNVVSIMLSLFFFSIAALLAVIKLVLGFKAMMEHGIREVASPSLWIIIPILTLMGITMVRLSHGIHVRFETAHEPHSLFVVMAAILSLQILFGLVGWVVMRRLGYFRDYIGGAKRDAGSFALICPGVAFFVFGMFFIAFGLVKTDLVGHLSAVYFLLLLPFAVVQLKTVQVLFQLKSHVLHAPA